MCREQGGEGGAKRDGHPAVKRSVAAGECVEGWGSLKWAAGLSGGEKGAAEMSRLM
ncbi:MAG: hypothetical protein GQ469_01770 [Methanosarcinales archaeon]|nr:hypothetical protein [Methanosarcinales archaeon]